MTDLSPGGVRASISGVSNTGAGLTTCPSGGSEDVGLVGQGITATIECVTRTAGTHSTSRVSAAPTNNGDRTVIVSSNGAWAYLAPGQTVEKGSPITAAPTNTRPVPVELIDAGGIVFGSFDLDKGESVDVEISLAQNGQPQVLLDVIDGSITFSVFDQTRTIETGESHTFTPDSTPPALSLPGDLTVEATSASGATVMNAASATDNVDGTVAVNCTSEPRSMFAIGTTSVTCSATDAAGNGASGNFNITVVDTTAPAIIGASLNTSVL